jgi:hypothetical protein
MRFVNGTARFLAGLRVRILADHPFLALHEARSPACRHSGNLLATLEVLRGRGASESGRVRMVK